MSLLMKWGMNEKEVVDKGKMTVQENGRLRFDADLGRIVGTSGETEGRVVLDPKSKEVITQFPQRSK